MKKTRASMQTTKRKSKHATLLAVAISIGGVSVMPLAAGAALWLTPGQASAAANVPMERVADGRVLGKTDSPISGAIVFLKDSRSQSIRTYICDKEGRFHFGQLTQDTDYEIWAEANGMRSKTKAISSFDSKNNYDFTLRIDTAK